LNTYKNTYMDLILSFLAFHKNVIYIYRNKIKKIGKWVPLYCTLRGGVDLGLG